MKIIIEMELGNSAFEVPGNEENERIADGSSVADTIQFQVLDEFHGGMVEIGQGGKIADFNGNTVGSWKVINA